MRNLREREAVDIADRVNNVIGYLKVRAEVVAAVRKESKSSSKPGIVIANIRTEEEKEQIMRAKKDLKNSSRYKDVYIEQDIPSYHRTIRNNLHTIVTTLGQEKIEIRGSRVYKSEQARNYGELSHHGYRLEEPRNHYSQESSYGNSHYDWYRNNDRRSNYHSRQDQDQDSLLVKRRNGNHSPGPVIRELVPSSHQRSEFSNTILCNFSRCDQRTGEGIPIPDSPGEDATFINICISNGSLKCHRVLISTTPSFGDRVICWYTGYTFKTLIQQYKSIVFPPFLEGFPF